LRAQAAVASEQDYGQPIYGNTVTNLGPLAVPCTLPVPNWPALLLPQQYTAPDAVLAQLCEVPTLSWTAPATPKTRAGAPSQYVSGGLTPLAAATLV
jgi:hypothetical protein